MPLQICCPHLSSRLTPVLEISVPIICDAILLLSNGEPTLRGDATIDPADHDHDDATPGSVRASHLPDSGRLTPDEYAARRDALRAIHAMVPADRRDLYHLWLALRENGERGERGSLEHVHAYAQRHGIRRRTVYFRMEQLADALQRHPWFAELTAPFLPLRRAA